MQEKIWNQESPFGFFLYSFLAGFSSVCPPCMYFSSKKKKKSQSLCLILQLQHVMLDINDCPACPELLSCFQQITIIELTITPATSHASLPLSWHLTHLTSERGYGSYQP